MGEQLDQVDVEPAAKREASVDELARGAREPAGAEHDAVGEPRGLGEEQRIAKAFASRS